MFDSALNIILIIAAAAVFVFILVKVIQLIISNLHFEANKVSLDADWVEDAFYDEAHYQIEKKYNSIGKPIYTQKDEYRANYMNEVNKTAATLISTCCEGNTLSKDFCKFIEKKHPNIRRKELILAISDYISAREKALQESMDAFLDEVQDITPDEFFEIRQKMKGDVVGVYIIHNETTDQYYVGQAKKLFFRINQHFTGHGNGDVYADYKYGDDFSIKIIRLSESGYDDIDKLEKDMIKKYNAYSIGYNRTSGNY